MSTRVLLINGSSRTTGRTAALLKTILSEFSRRGVQASLIHLRNVALKPGDGNQTSRLRSDFRGLFTRLITADGIVFATPTYWFNMSGLMKTLFDRMIIAENGWPLEGTVAGFIATGESHEDGAIVALTSMAATANHLGMVTFPYSLVYCRRGKPGWAKAAIANYAENMLHMITIMQRDGKRPWR
jgi:multimeric flavodoxin WrbA